MRLFISYSRDDKAWVYELWRALRDRAFHDAWIDQRIVPAQDWWETILQNVEDCECCIYIMTPKSVDSIYCRAEVDYAVALNKPIVPLMLKSCDYPPRLKNRRIQYQVITDDMGLGDVLFTIERSLSDVRVGLVKNKWQLPLSMPRRPVEPRPENTSAEIIEVFMLAEEAANENNFSLAVKLFQQVAEADPQGWGFAAVERLGEVRFEHDRIQDYLNIVRMTENPALLKGAQAAWRMFVAKHGLSYDPNGLGNILTERNSTAHPKKSLSDELKVGAVIDGIVVSTSPTSVLVDVGAKSEGIIPGRELERMNRETLDMLKPGATIPVFVVNPHDHQGNIILSVNLALEEEDWRQAEEYRANKTVYESRIAGYNKGGLIVRFGRVRGFVPQSQISAERRAAMDGETPEERWRGMVNEPIAVKVMEVDRSRNRLILSESAVARKVRG